MSILRATTLLLLATISIVPVAQAAQEVNLYSARKEKLIKPLLDRFTQQTGIKVNLVTGKANALLQRLKSEGRNTPADLLLTTDAGNLYRAQQAELLQAVESKTLESSVPAHYREPEGHWYGLSVRARTIFYANDRVDPKELGSYAGLTDPKWKGRICIRSSNNIYNQSLVASMIAHQGVAKTEEWVNGLVKNFARRPKGGDRDQIRAAAAGECDIAIANTYYYGAMQTSSKERDRAAAKEVSLFWANQDSTGTHVNISGGAVTRYAGNKENAIKLLEFLVNDESQRWYGEVNNEYPVKSGVEISGTLKKWGEFKADTLDLHLLGKYNAEAVRIMDRAGWR
ncbi:MAG: Fe(3+) ABC transporter substrate-binding protein [Gammaproteobacteria bacterium]|nr:Fe(3+) ABC transporter substrate-binding protein [Gammaproteobacteria bacterium]